MKCYTARYGRYFIQLLLLFSLTPVNIREKKETSPDLLSE